MTAFVLSVWLVIPHHGFARSARSISADNGGFQGLIIDSIEIDNQNIYDLKKEEFDKFFFKTINRFHIKTVQNIIKREVLLKVGQPFDSALANETERILRQRLLVYDAWVTPLKLDNGRLKIVITTVDQWSLNGGVDYSKEGDDRRIRIGLREKNLLGYNLRLSGYFVDDSREGEYFEGSFTELRFLGQPLALSANYNDNPKAKNRALLIEHPYYNMAQNWSAFALLSFTKGRQDFYEQNLLSGRSYYNQDFFEGAISYRYGENYNKKTIKLLYLYNFETNNNIGVSMFDQYKPTDSAYHQIGLKVKYEKYRFYEGVNFDGMNYTEDIILGRFYSFSYKRAFRADFEKSYYYKLESKFIFNFQIKELFLFSETELNYWLNSGTQLRRNVILNLNGYYKPFKKILFAGRGNLNLDRHQNSLENLILGGNTGIRGFDTYFKSGHNRLIFNLESRIVTPISFWTIQLGAVSFLDGGRIWTDEDQFEFDNFYMSYGLGLRIGFENSTQNIVRLDFARTNLGSWEISAGTGQYFNLPGSI